MPQAIVTGAGGFVGAALVRHLLARGDSVIAVVRPGATAWRLEDIHDSVRVEPLDLRSRDATIRLLAQCRPDCVFHLAAHGAYSWQTALTEMIEVNIAATANLLDAFAQSGGRAFVNAGSSSEYGFKSSAPSEDDRIDPNSHYAITKATATHLCRYFARTHGLRAVTLRLYSIYGPWEDPRRLIPKLVTAGLDGGYPPLAKPATARDFVYIDDVCDAFVRTAEAASCPDDAVINIGSGAQTTLAEVARVAGLVFGIAEPPVWGSSPDRPWDTGSWVADARLADRVLDWRANTTLADGLAKTADWMRSSANLLKRYQAA
jgi:dolichol-phosphate mannosyltransferase